MLLIGIEPKRVFAMQLSIAAVTPSSFSRSRGSSVGQRAVTGLIFQNLDFSLKIHKKAEVKREMDSVPQQRSQAACNHRGWYTAAKQHQDNTKDAICTRTQLYSN